ncbi:MAG TPA: lipopolysaccharide heptosyltransferase II [candidate division Zixibacteria bacterium]|nr:lipopolysaccharide heptosyltransferase II [candidate division Zixibacteria bacterium]
MIGAAAKILVAQTSFLGDTVLTVPLLAELRRRFPAARLALLCTGQGAELLAGHPDIDEIIVDDKRRADRGLRGLLRKAAELRARGFDLAVTPHKSLRTALLLYLARIPRRAGFRQSRGWFLFNLRTDRDPARHDVERNLSVVRALGVPPEDCGRTLRLPSSPADVAAAGELLRAAGVDDGKPIIGLNPGSVWPTKKWPAQSFARLAELLKLEMDCEIVVFGGPEDAAVAAEIQAACAARVTSLAGKTSLRLLSAALGGCRLLVTNDSGPMHIAVARGIPVVAIFCATTPALGFYPYSARAIVVEKKLPCRPCGSHGGRRCPLGTEDCSRLIPPEAVLAAARELLRDGAEGAAGYAPRVVSL